VRLVEEGLSDVERACEDYHFCLQKSVRLANTSASHRACVTCWDPDWGKACVNWRDCFRALPKRVSMEQAGLLKNQRVLGMKESVSLRALEKF